MSDFIRLSKSFLGIEEREAVCRVIDGAMLGMGEEVKNFEHELKAYLGGQVYVACVNTGTSALHLALQGLDIGPGDEVLVPSLTYVASFQAISATGAFPVACDVESATGFIDLADAASRITKNTKAIMPVHFASYIGGMPRVYKFAEAYGLKVVEDAAHSFGCRLNGEPIGSFGQVVCFSFDGIKNITSGEGGAVVSRDFRLIERINDLRLLGVRGDTSQRFTGGRSWAFDVMEQGWRYHMSDLMAAIGRAQLRKSSIMFKRRMEIRNYYIGELQRINNINLYDIDTPGAEIVPHIFPVKVSSATDLVRHLLSSGIQAGRHYQSNHLLSYYWRGTKLPTSEELSSMNVSLPLHPNLSDSEVQFVIDKVTEYFT